ncbi:MAG: hypothetical protein LBN96_05320 [Desulfovibrio sp.]|jgi:hypothetical protein|nr:hypothetical protein [Desulfovibrio sp.]
MLKPFYQGKLDTFCAIYAVLNALRLTHGIRTLKARDLLNETLLSLADRPGALRAVLEQDTDYLYLVDELLTLVGKKFPLKIHKPFDENDHPSPQEVWETCHAWFEAGRPRAVVLRFLRSRKPESPPDSRHWTTADRMDDKTLHLFDCSHEAEAILNIGRESFVTRQEDVNNACLLFIQPSFLRFLRLPF